MEKLSVVIITYNEEKNIERCLLSVKDFSSEIVVVDSFSTDETVSICKKYGVKLISREFIGYGDQKNYGNNAASSDWIFSIDADEEVSPDLKKSIQDIMKSPGSSAYEVSRFTNYCGKWVKHTDWYPDRKVRLFNRNNWKWNDARVHEELEGQEKIIRLDGNLNHYTFYTIQEHIAQLNKFTTLAAEEKFNKGKKGRLAKIIFSPMVKFMKSYIFRLGILDGFTGFTIARISAFATYLTYAKLRKLNRESTPVR